MRHPAKYDLHTNGNREFEGLFTQTPDQRSKCSKVQFHCRLLKHPSWQPFRLSVFYVHTVPLLSTISDRSKPSSIHSFRPVTLQFVSSALVTVKCTNKARCKHLQVPFQFHYQLLCSIKLKISSVGKFYQSFFQIQSEIFAIMMKCLNN